MIRDDELRILLYVSSGAMQHEHAFLVADVVGESKVPETVKDRRVHGVTAGVGGRNPTRPSRSRRKRLCTNSLPHN